MHNIKSVNKNSTSSNNTSIEKDNILYNNKSIEKDNILNNNTSIDKNNASLIAEMILNKMLAITDNNHEKIDN